MKIGGKASLEKIESDHLPNFARKGRAYMKRGASFNAVPSVTRGIDSVVG